jgi:DNA replication protein DnaC
MAEAYETQLHDPQIHGLSFDERLGLLADQEWSGRQSRRLARRLQDAKLPLAATIEDIDYTVPRGLDRVLMRTLADGRWMNEHQSA